MEITIDTNKMNEVGNNILATIQGDLMILAIDIGKDLGPSASGKMIGIASTSGFAAFPGNTKCNFYLGKKA